MQDIYIKTFCDYFYSFLINTTVIGMVLTLFVCINKLLNM